MDGSRFDSLAKTIGGDRSRRSLIKKLAGGLAGAVAIGVPARASALPIGSYCSKDSDCDHYGSMCKDGTCQCPEGQYAPDGSHCEPIDCPYGKTWCGEEQKCIKEDQCCGGCGYGEQCCNGTCIPEDGCCDDYDCSGGKVCNSYSHICVCPEGETECDGKCLKPGQCCGDYDCGANQVCKDKDCVCDYGFKDCDGACIPEAGCCGEYDCGYGEVCEYGTCVPEGPPTSEGGNNGSNYTKSCKARCQRKCLKSGRKKGKLSGAKLRSTCKNRCKRNCS